MLAIEMKNISKSFGGVAALSHVNLQVEKGHIHCLLGENGAGKSTLMNILFGLYKSDEGSIWINEKQVHIDNANTAYTMGLGMVHQHFMLVENMTVLENIVLGHEYGKIKLDMKRAAQEIKALSDQYDFGLDVHQKIKNLSVGMKQRVEIMKTLYRGAQILILDEPTAVLTPQEVVSLLQILNELRNEGKTIIFITHKLNETMQVADAITVLRAGKEVAQLPIIHVDEKKLAQLMVGREINKQIQRATQVNTQKVLSIKNLKILPQSQENLNFEIHSGEIFGIAGVDGNGQQELEECIMGLYKACEGEVFLDNQLISNLSTQKIKDKGIAYIPSDRLKRGIVSDFSLLDNYMLGNQYRKKYSNFGFLNFNKMKNHAENLIQQFQVRTTGLGQKTGSLSGGNQQKLVLSREVSENPRLIIAAQPIRGLDIGAIEKVHQTLMDLRNQGKAILLISTELSEVMQLSDRIAVLYKGSFMDIKPANELTKEQIGLLMAGRKEAKIHASQK